MQIHTNPVPLPEHVADVGGMFGRAWHMYLAESSTTALLNPALWVVHCPGAHPFWHSYVVGVITLAPVEGMPPAKMYLDGATHELYVYALNPETKGRRYMSEFLPYLQPANFIAQVRRASNEAVAVTVRKVVEMIVQGRLNPDTDNRAQWVGMFGRNSFENNKEPMTGTWTDGDPE